MWGTAQRPVPTSLGDAPVRPRSFRGPQGGQSKSLSFRERQLNSIGDQKMQAQSERLGRAGRSLAVPEHDYPAISASQMESMDLLMGDVPSPMEMRLNSLSNRPAPSAKSPASGR